jgi:prevent-host-death family protein
MGEVTIRELRNQGGKVLDRVERGETLTVTRDGRPVAELRPLPRPPLTREVLLERMRGVPRVDPGKLRADLDAIIDPRLFPDE